MKQTHKERENQQSYLNKKKENVNEFGLEIQQRAVCKEIRKGKK